MKQQILTFTELGKWGRLANQLFEIATVIGTAGKYNRDWYIPNTIPYIEALTGNTLKYNHNTYFFQNSGMRVYEPSWGNWNNAKEYIYDRPEYKEIILNESDRVVDLKGYFQSFKYFENAEQEVRTCLKLPVGIEERIYIESLKQKGNRVIALGVRLSDYLKTQDFYWNLTNTDYYINALRQFSKDDVFLVFSDDIELAKTLINSEIYEGYKFEYANNLEFRIDCLPLYSICDGYICANSTFHLWGAWLGNENNDKKVVCPANWYKTDDFTAKNIYPKGAIVI